MLLLFAENCCLKGFSNIAVNHEYKPEYFCPKHEKHSKMRWKASRNEMFFFWHFTLPGSGFHFGASLENQVYSPSEQKTYFAMCPLKESGEFVLVGVCLGSAALLPDRGMFRIILAALQKVFLDSDPSSASLSALVCSLLDLPEVFCGICCNTPSRCSTNALGTTRAHQLAQRSWMMRLQATFSRKYQPRVGNFPE